MTAFYKRVPYFVVVVLALSLSACAPFGGATPGTGDQQPEVDLANTRWRLVSYGEPGSETPVIEGAEPTLEFEEGTQAGGSSGCNSFGAQYQVQGGELSFGEIESTLMACTAEGVMEQEQQYFQALQTAGEFDVTDQQLTIWYGDGQSVLNFVRIGS
jgi:heat shock protein HslJ